MSEISFALRAERVLESLLERLGDEDALADLDADLIDGVLRVDFDSGAVLIINRQEPVQQLWVASPEGPAHFSYDATRDAWVDDRSGEVLTEVLSRVFSQQTGTQVHLKGPL
ncbi:iron donor protein CyaY [Acidihalobacter aeolianus]|uniref:Iron-sulfur cluster assembly protein CyaY n=1 Tax=Acidihalobacter aeolianus TaxID=2792603 RepID=A0A1D8K7M6_9GAMM|nr:iron donor protein CyaY [Acidihalobacter aeolianus]AOV16971.1 iron donor protein CyaY [Acidihalobacter aeolianus]